LTCAHDLAMYFESPTLRAVLLSVHLPLREAIANIDEDHIVALAKLTDRELTKVHGKRPRIAVAAVNPHAGEGGRFGDEEALIARAVGRAGVDISGPYPADAVFRGQYDVVLAMYHDQALKIGRASCRERV